MARRAHDQNSDRPQTLKEARRAYQKASRTSSLTSAQFRAAERAAEADERAKDILAKEKRAKEAKRKRAEQETKQKEAQRKLVQEGKLPEESLWGKVRSSQPRLHNFFVAPENVGAGKKSSHASPGEKGQDRDVRSSSRLHVEDGKSSVESGASSTSAPTIPKWQKTSPMPRENSTTAPATHKDEVQREAGYSAEQVDSYGAPEFQQAVNVPLSFGDSQILLEVADDLPRGNELNGQVLPVKYAGSKAQDRERAMKKSQGLRSNKRRADFCASGTSTAPKSARRMLSPSSPINMNVRLSMKSVCKSSRVLRADPGDSGKHNLSSDRESGLQIQALLKPQDFEDNLLLSNKENLDPLHSAASTSGRLHGKLEMPRSSTKKLLPQHRPSMSSPQREEDDPNRWLALGAHGGLDTGNQSCASGDQSEDDFGSDLDDAFLGLSSQFGAAVKPPFRENLASINLTRHKARQGSPPKPTAKHDSSLGPKVQDSQSDTQGSSYELEGVSDADLLGLVDQLSSEKRENDLSPERSPSARSKSGRTFPWEISTKVLDE